ncbi:mitogen-activated protein kinase kinase kinase 7-like isoform X1 [Anneissia japonica]|uniref:mitogen-activated protein kinase kinase kinase 7-like isoform X1 n=1 Tax=Anneissia japonica TaxID=1529436 RepID=UPI00142580DA|nr:mitogen-activated protein kinase kinase kinase 7-like isoform X1 [Anneissia japonica]
MSKTLQTQESFAEEIDYNDLKFEKIVGRGAFGVVSKARWRNKDVAVKMIESEAEIKAFLVELRQLSRVEHENIVRLYGSCQGSPVCLVMEYAEGGSLYNVLHAPPPQPEYTAAHAMSWAYQCSRGVSYLHGMKPQALIHRDLKPANLLLVAGGTVLKICDFGTACDIQTYMTNNKGSAAWMAPEVFEGNQYSERCDVFSWSIILWEVITRRKPFSEIGGPAFRIMWAVHQGKRPPLIRNLPKPIEKLMTRCWSKEPTQRPSMAEVASIMSKLMEYFKGADVPLVYPQVAKDKNTADSQKDKDEDDEEDLDEESVMTSGSQIPESRANTLSDTVINQRSSQDVEPPMYLTLPTPQQSNVAHLRGTLANVHLDPNYENKRKSTDFAELRFNEEQKKPVMGHRRSNSHGQTFTPSQISTNQPKPEPNLQFLLTSSNAPAVNILPSSPAPHSPIPHSNTVPSNLGDTFDFIKPKSRSFSEHQILNQTDPYEAEGALQSGRLDQSSANAAPSQSAYNNQPGSSRSSRATRSVSLDNQGAPQQSNPDDGLPMAYMTLDSRLQPLPPNPNSKESLEVFDSHCKMAQDYLRVQTEIALLHQRKKVLAGQLDQDYKEQQSTFHYYEEYLSVKNQSERLKEQHRLLKESLDYIRRQQPAKIYHPPS